MPNRISAGGYWISEPDELDALNSYQTLTVANIYPVREWRDPLYCRKHERSSPCSAAAQTGVYILFIPQSTLATRDQPLVCNFYLSQNLHPIQLFACLANQLTAAILRLTLSMCSSAYKSTAKVLQLNSGLPARRL